MTLTNIPKLTELCAPIDARLAEIAKKMGPRPAFSSETMKASWDWLERKDALVAAFRAELEFVHGARFRQTGGDHTMRMAGVSSSCTMGWEALLKNWQNAARRAIEKAEEAMRAGGENGKHEAQQARRAAE